MTTAVHGDNIGDLSGKLFVDNSWSFFNESVTKFIILVGIVGRDSNFEYSIDIDGGIIKKNAILDYRRMLMFARRR